MDRSGAPELTKMGRLDGPGLTKIRGPGFRNMAIIRVPAVLAARTLATKWGSPKMNQNSLSGRPRNHLGLSLLRPGIDLNSPTRWSKFEKNLGSRCSINGQNSGFRYPGGPKWSFLNQTQRINKCFCIY